VVLGRCFASGQPRSGGSSLRDARGRGRTDLLASARDSGKRVLAPGRGGCRRERGRASDGTGARAGRDGAASFGGSLGEKGREGTGSGNFAKLPEREPLRRSAEEVAGRLRKDGDLGRAECGKRAACRRIA